MAGLLIKELLTRGELVDERALGSEPRLLFCLEHGLQDGRKTRTGQQPLISNRLQFLEISRSGEVSPAASGPYLDEHPLREAEQPLVAPLLQESWLAQVKRELLERIAKAEREIRARMQREIYNWSRRYAEVLVIPAGLLLSLQGQNDPADVDATARKRVELLAMNAVFEAEEALGHMPKDVAAERGLGHDIESSDADSNLFFIEVKGRADGADSVTLTINEVNTGRNAPIASAWRW